jgi:putative hemolysin
MRSKGHLLSLMGLGTILLLAACQQSRPAQVINQPGLANPASMYCNAAGYEEETRTDSNGGQYGVCIFPDGTECDSWEFFGGECGQDKSFCVQKGGTLESRNGDAMCVFPNGSTCPEFEFSQGQCSASE